MDSDSQQSIHHQRRAVYTYRLSTLAVVQTARMYVRWNSTKCPYTVFRRNYQFTWVILYDFCLHSVTASLSDISIFRFTLQSFHLIRIYICSALLCDRHQRSKHDSVYYDTRIWHLSTTLLSWLLAASDGSPVITQTSPSAASSVQHHACISMSVDPIPAAIRTDDVVRISYGQRGVIRQCGRQTKRMMGRRQTAHTRFRLSIQDVYRTIEWHHYQCPWMTLNWLLFVWNLSNSHNFKKNK